MAQNSTNTDLVKNQHLRVHLQCLLRMRSHLLLCLSVTDRNKITRSQERSSTFSRNNPPSYKKTNPKHLAQTHFNTFPPIKMLKHLIRNFGPTRIVSVYKFLLEHKILFIYVWKHETWAWKSPSKCTAQGITYKGGTFSPQQHLFRLHSQPLQAPVTTINMSIRRARIFFH